MRDTSGGVPADNAANELCPILSDCSRLRGEGETVVTSEVDHIAAEFTLR
jgi:hypothetical protein